jgi:hypothetical protein
MHHVTRQRHIHEREQQFTEIFVGVKRRQIERFDIAFLNDGRQRAVW